MAQNWTGAMIALVVPDPENYAINPPTENSLPPEELHITLAYLGDASEISPEQREAILDACQVLSDTTDAPELLFPASQGVFLPDPESPDPDPKAAYYAAPASPEKLNPLREDLLVHLAARGVGDLVSTKHPVFTPHVTLTYEPLDVPQNISLPTPMPTRFGTLLVKFGNEAHTFELGQPEEGPALPFTASVQRSLKSLAASTRYSEDYVTALYLRQRHVRATPAQTRAKAALAAVTASLSPEHSPSRFSRADELLKRLSLSASPAARTLIASRALALVSKETPTTPSEARELAALTASIQALIADGNSSIARSIRARKQLRDRKGRWIEMGGGVRFKIRKPGTPGGGKWEHGTVEGFDIPNGRVNVRLEDGRLVAIPNSKLEQPKAIIGLKNRSKDKVDSTAPGATTPAAKFQPKSAGRVGRSTPEAEISKKERGAKLDELDSAAFDAIDNIKTIAQEHATGDVIGQHIVTLANNNRDKLGENVPDGSSVNVTGKTNPLKDKTFPVSSEDLTAILDNIDYRAEGFLPPREELDAMSEEDRNKEISKARGQAIASLSGMYKDRDDEDARELRRAPGLNEDDLEEVSDEKAAQDKADVENAQTPDEELVQATEDAYKELASDVPDGSPLAQTRDQLRKSLDEFNSRLLDGDDSRDDYLKNIDSLKKVADDTERDVLPPGETKNSDETAFGAFAEDLDNIQKGAGFSDDQGEKSVDEAPVESPDSEDSVSPENPENLDLEDEEAYSEESAYEASTPEMAAAVDSASEVMGALADAMTDDEGEPLDELLNEDGKDAASKFLDLTDEFFSTEFDESADNIAEFKDRFDTAAADLVDALEQNGVADEKLDALKNANDDFSDSLSAAHDAAPDASEEPATVQSPTDDPNAPSMDSLFSLSDSIKNLSESYDMHPELAEELDDYANTIANVGNDLQNNKITPAQASQILEDANDNANTFFDGDRFGDELTATNPDLGDALAELIDEAEFARTKLKDGKFKSKSDSKKEESSEVPEETPETSEVPEEAEDSSTTAPASEIAKEILAEEPDAALVETTVPEAVEAFDEQHAALEALQGEFDSVDEAEEAYLDAIDAMHRYEAKLEESEQAHQEDPDAQAVIAGETDRIEAAAEKLEAEAPAENDSFDQGSLSEEAVDSVVEGLNEDPNAVAQSIIDVLQQKIANGDGVSKKDLDDIQNLLNGMASSSESTDEEKAVLNTTADKLDVDALPENLDTKSEPENVDLAGEPDLLQKLNDLPVGTILEDDDGVTYTKDPDGSWRNKVYSFSAEEMANPEWDKLEVVYEPSTGEAPSGQEGSTPQGKPVFTLPEVFDNLDADDPNLPQILEAFPVGTRLDSWKDSYTKQQDGTWADISGEPIASWELALLSGGDGLQVGYIPDEKSSSSPFSGLEANTNADKVAADKAAAKEYSESLKAAPVPAHSTGDKLSAEDQQKVNDIWEELLSEFSSKNTAEDFEVSAPVTGDNWNKLGKTQLAEAKEIHKELASDWDNLPADKLFKAIEDHEAGKITDAALISALNNELLANPHMSLKMQSRIKNLQSGIQQNTKNKVTKLNPVYKAYSSDPISLENIHVASPAQMAITLNNLLNQHGNKAEADHLNPEVSEEAAILDMLIDAKSGEQAAKEGLFEGDMDKVVSGLESALARMDDAINARLSQVGKKVDDDVIRNLRMRRRAIDEMLAGLEGRRPDALEGGTVYTKGTPIQTVDPTIGVPNKFGETMYPGDVLVGSTKNTTGSYGFFISHWMTAGSKGELPFGKFKKAGYDGLQQNEALNSKKIYAVGPNNPLYHDPEYTGLRVDNIDPDVYNYKDYEYPETLHDYVTNPKTKFIDPQGLDKVTHDGKPITLDQKKLDQIDEAVKKAQADAEENDPALKTAADAKAAEEQLTSLMSEINSASTDEELDAVSVKIYQAYMNGEISLAQFKDLTDAIKAKKNGPEDGGPGGGGGPENDGPDAPDDGPSVGADLAGHPNAVEELDALPVGSTIGVSDSGVDPTKLTKNPDGTWKSSASGEDFVSSDLEELGWGSIQVLDKPNSPETDTQSATSAPAIGTDLAGHPDMADELNALPEGSTVFITSTWNAYNGEWIKDSYGNWVSPDDTGFITPNEFKNVPADSIVVQDIPGGSAEDVSNSEPQGYSLPDNYTSPPEGSEVLFTHDNAGGEKAFVVKHPDGSYHMYRPQDTLLAPPVSKGVNPMSSVNDVTVKNLENMGWTPVNQKIGAPTSVPETTPVGEEAANTTVKTYDISGWTPGKAMGGSNGARLYTDPEGNKYVVKPSTGSSFASSQHNANMEALASVIYNDLGYKAPEVGFTTLSNGVSAIVSKFVDHKPLGELSGAEAEEAKKKLFDNYAIDTWLANYDLLGLHHANVGVDADGNIVYIDNGGTFSVEAKGGNKAWWGTEAKDFDMWSSGVTPSDSKAWLATTPFYKDITPEQKVESAKKLQNISDQDIFKLVDKIPTMPLADKLKLSETLVARRDSILKKAGLPLTANESDTFTPTSKTGQLDAFGQELKVGDLVTHKAKTTGKVISGHVVKATPTHWLVKYTDENGNSKTSKISPEKWVKINTSPTSAQHNFTPFEMQNLTAANFVSYQKPDTSSPWYGKEAPKKPKSQFESTIDNPIPYLGQDWYDEAEKIYQTYQANAGKPVKPLNQSTAWDQYKNVIDHGMESYLDKLYNKDKISEALYQKAKDAIAQRNLDIAHESQQLQDALSKWKLDMQSWRAAQGQPSLKLPTHEDLKLLPEQSLKESLDIANSIDYVNPGNIFSQQKGTNVSGAHGAVGGARKKIKVGDSLAVDAIVARSDIDSMSKHVIVESDKLIKSGKYTIPDGTVLRVTRTNSKVSFKKQDGTTVQDASDFDSLVGSLQFDAGLMEASVGSPEKGGWTYPAGDASVIMNMYLLPGVTGVFADKNAGNDNWERGFVTAGPSVQLITGVKKNVKYAKNINSHSEPTPYKHSIGHNFEVELEVVVIPQSLYEQFGHFEGIDWVNNPPIYTPEGTSGPQNGLGGPSNVPNAPTNVPTNGPTNVPEGPTNVPDAPSNVPQTPPQV